MSAPGPTPAFDYLPGCGSGETCVNDRVCCPDARVCTFAPAAPETFRLSLKCCLDPDTEECATIGGCCPKGKVCPAGGETKCCQAGCCDRETGLGCVPGDEPKLCGAGGAACEDCTKLGPDRG